MAVVTSRVYHAIAPVFNGVSLGGMSTITLQYGYDAVTRAVASGYPGTLRNQPRVKFVRGTLVTQDISKAMTIMAAAPSNLTFYIKEEATSPLSYMRRVLMHPVVTGLRCRVDPEPGAPATMEFPFECKFLSAVPTIVSQFHEVDVVTKNVLKATAEDTRTIPLMYDEMTVCSYGVTTPIVLSHLKGISFSVGGDVIRDRNAGAAGYDSIHFVPRTVDLDITSLDTKVLDTPTKMQMQAVLDRGADRLDVTLARINGANDMDIKFHNTVFTLDSETEDATDYGTHALSASCDWLDSDGTTIRDLSDSTSSIIEITT